MPKYIVPLFYADEKQLIWEVVEARGPRAAEARAIKQREADGEFGEELFRYGGEPLSAQELERMAKNLRG